MALPKTKGGNGGYSLRKPVKDKPDPKKAPKVPYTYSGKDARKNGGR